MEKSAKALRSKIVDYVTSQGFSLNGHRNFMLPPGDREKYRIVQERTRREKLRQHLDFLRSEFAEASALQPHGRQLDPGAIELELKLVTPGSFEERLFKWWNLVWWSLPYQKTYGRQLRFVLWDRAHGAPFGLIGLHSAPLKMAVRDDALGITKEGRDWWVNMSLSAQRVGALPPYNELLGGKMVALTLTTNELRRAYKVTYLNRVSVIKGRVLPPDLLFVTTTGAFGRSSIYNRLKYKGQAVSELLGYTKGSGSFHLPDSLFRETLNLLTKHDVDVSIGFGHGPSRKRQLMSIASMLLDLPGFEYHGVVRAFYLFPHASNLKDVIARRGKPTWHNRPFGDLVDYWKQRWAIPRSQRISRWREFDPVQFFQNASAELENLDDAAI